MRPTRLRALLTCVVVGAVLGYLLAELAYGDLPPLPRYAPVTLVLLAVVELAMAKVVRDRVLRRSRRGARALHPLQVARAVALAKASSPAGALLLGTYGALFVWLLPKEATQARDDTLVSGISALSALLLVVAALLLERACRAPDLPDDTLQLGVAGVTDGLDDLTTEELRQRAFDRAREAHDRSFFWDLAKHLRGARAIAAEDGSAGGITGTITELVDLGREMLGKDLGDDEPLVRARFLEYLRA